MLFLLKRTFQFLHRRTPCRSTAVTIVATVTRTQTPPSRPKLKWTIPHCRNAWIATNNVSLLQWLFVCRVDLNRLGQRGKRWWSIYSSIRQLSSNQHNKGRGKWTKWKARVRDDTRWAAVIMASSKSAGDVWWLARGGATGERLEFGKNRMCFWGFPPPKTSFSRGISTVSSSETFGLVEEKMTGKGREKSWPESTSWLLLYSSMFHWKQVASCWSDGWMGGSQRNRKNPIRWVLLLLSSGGKRGRRRRPWRVLRIVGAQCYHPNLCCSLWF